MQCEEGMHRRVHGSGKLQLHLCMKIVEFVGDLLAREVPVNDENVWSCILCPSGLKKG